MNVIFMKELYTNNIDCIIITKTTTKDEVQRIIDKVKADMPDDYTFDDIREQLPSDCKVYCQWEDIEVVYY